MDSSADADPDGDGASNLAEYIAGTDPRRSDSVFRVAVAFENGLRLSFYSRRADGLGYEGLERTYTVETTRSLAPSAWKPDIELRKIPGLDRPLDLWLSVGPDESGTFVRVAVGLQTRILSTRGPVANSTGRQ